MIFFSFADSVKFHWHSPFSLHLQLFLCKSISELLYCNKCSWNVVNTGHGQLRLLSNQTNYNCPGESSKDQLWKRWNVWGVKKTRVMLGLPGVSQQNWREGIALLLQVQLLCFMCACTCIQWVKTLAPQSLHFFPRIILSGDLQVRYLSALLHLFLFQVFSDTPGCLFWLWEWHFKLPLLEQLLQVQNWALRMSTECRTHYLISHGTIKETYTS